MLWPDPAPVPYRARLADAVAGLADCLDAVADTWSGHPTGRDRLAVRLPGAIDAAVGWPDDLGQDLYHLADLRVRLDGLRDDLSRIIGSREPGPWAAPEPPAPDAVGPLGTTSAESVRARIR